MWPRFGALVPPGSASPANPRGTGLSVSAPSRQTALQSAQRIEVSLAAHKRIFATVAERDPDRAAAAMREHLDQIQRLIVPRGR